MCIKIRDGTIRAGPTWAGPTWDGPIRAGSWGLKRFENYIIPPEKQNTFK